MGNNGFDVDYEEPTFLGAKNNLLRASDEGPGSNQTIDDDE